MSLSEKLKAERKKRRLTQQALSEGIITRNMLSSIESGNATPSLETLIKLADRLELPVGYFLSDDVDPSVYMKNDRMPSIRSALSSGSYNLAISLIEKIGKMDDELYFVLAQCYFNLCESSVRSGSLLSAKKYALLCLENCTRTVYDTERFEMIIPLYSAIASNSNAPLLELDLEKYGRQFKDSTEEELYHYLVGDADYSYTDHFFKTHIEAKQLIKNRKYTLAAELLTELEKSKKRTTPNAYLSFCLYSDHEACYKQLFDYENAYKYASKRISLMEGFQS